MRTKPILAGIAVGAAIGIGGIATADLMTEDAKAQGDPVTEADLRGANLRSQAAINIGKRTWNLVTRYVAEPGEIVGASDGPITQQRGVGRGIPANLVQGGAAGPPGPTGPQGPAGTFKGMRVIDGPTVNVAPGAVDGASAECPVGTVLTGGGFFSSITHVGGAIPSFNNRVYSVVVVNDTGVSVGINAYAICAET